MFCSKQMPPISFIERAKEAIRKIDIDEVKELLTEAKLNQYELNCNDPKSKYTLLHFAVTKATESTELDMLEIITLLKTAGCNINKVANDYLHNSPIHTAARRALPSIVAWLIENGVNPNIKDTTNQTPLHYVEKQLNSSGEHMNDIVRNRLAEIKIKLLSNASNNKTITNIANQACKFGLFATVVLTGAVVIGTEIYKKYEMPHL